MARTPENAGDGSLRAPHAARVRTLIVDDSEAVIEGLSQLLAAQPYCEVVGAVSDPALAVAKAAALRPDVILQDFSMPGVDPFRLTRSLAALTPRPAVLVLSASADEPSARQALEAGAVGWVLKDAEPDELFDALLGAAGVGPPARPSLRRPEPEVSTNLDARTVWALLRALEYQPGLTPEDAAAHAVLPVAIAVRYLQRLTARRPALVARAIESALPGGRYTLTAAGVREIDRLERRIPRDASAQAI
jgi:DNA-binding NarL/FixJ family response regulator